MHTNSHCSDTSLTVLCQICQQQSNCMPKPCYNVTSYASSFQKHQGKPFRILSTSLQCFLSCCQADNLSFCSSFQESVLSLTTIFGKSSIFFFSTFNLFSLILPSHCFSSLIFTETSSQLVDCQKHWFTSVPIGLISIYFNDPQTFHLVSSSSQNYNIILCS